MGDDYTGLTGIATLYNGTYRWTIHRDDASQYHYAMLQEVSEAEQLAAKLTGAFIDLKYTSSFIANSKALKEGYRHYGVAYALIQKIRKEGRAN